MRLRPALWPLLILLVACGPLAAGGRGMGCGWTPDPELHGAHLDNECTKAWCQDPDLRPRVRALVEVAARDWGEDLDLLRGWKIRLVERDHVRCYGVRANGCTSWLTMTITIPVERWSCIEQTSLVHEAGHTTVALGDPGHWARGWWRNELFERQYDALVDGSSPPRCRGEPYRDHWIP